MMRMFMVAYLYIGQWLYSNGHSQNNCFSKSVPQESQIERGHQITVLFFLGGNLNRSEESLTQVKDDENQ